MQETVSNITIYEIVFIMTFFLNLLLGGGLITFFLRRVAQFCTKKEVETLIQEKLESVTKLIDAKLDLLSSKLDLILKDAHIEFKK
jgi:hypothetical protein